MESILNNTQIPLQPGAIFQGKPENVEPYNMAILTINTNKNSQITVYQGIANNYFETTQFNFTTGGANVFYCSLILPYVYMVVKNVSATPQTYLNFSVKYTNANLPDAVSSVSDSLTHTKLDTVNSNLNTINTSITNTNNILNDDVLPLLQESQKSNSTLWNNVASGINGVSSSVNLSQKQQSNLTFYGVLSGATTLTLQFSNDNITYYDSQYSYNSVAGGDFGFNVQASPMYCRLKSTNNITITAYLCFC